MQEKSRGLLVEALRSCTLILEQTAALWNRADEGEGEILRGLDAAAETAEAHRWGDSNCGGGQAVAGASPLSQWFSGRSRESVLRRDWPVCPDVCAALRGRRAPCCKGRSCSRLCPDWLSWGLLRGPRVSWQDCRGCRSCCQREAGARWVWVRARCHSHSLCVCLRARHRLPWGREALLQTHIVVCRRSGQALGIGAPRRSEQDLELLARTRLSGSD